MATAIEYGLVAALISIAAIIGSQGLSENLSDSEKKAEQIVRKLPQARYNALQICQSQLTEWEARGPGTTITRIAGVKCDDRSAVLKMEVRPDWNHSGYAYIINAKGRPNQVTTLKPDEATL